mmetsp:Transcript_7983/g.19281  ORF Transcript_7983/g.19281 Transcript_7983/m.19281 type:complete len:858 (-) Transcript_7983:5849-8422(-)
MDDRKATFDFTEGMEDMVLSATADVQFSEDDDSVESVSPPVLLAPRRSARTSGMSDDSSDLFVSPKSQWSTESSVGGGSATKIKVMLFYVKDSQKYCAGKVGRGSTNQACIKPGCTTKEHQKAKNKLVLNDDSLYISTTGSMPSVLCNPCLPCSLVEGEEQLKYWKNSKNTIDVWRAEIDVVLAQHASKPASVLNIDTSNDVDVDGWSEVASPGSGEVQIAMDLMSTPTGANLGSVVKRILKEPEDKTKQPKIAEIPELPNPKADDDSGDFSYEGPTAFAVMKEEWKTIAENFNKIKGMLKLVETNQNEQKEVVVEGLQRIDKKLKLVDTKMHVTSSKLGDDALFSEGGSKTVWQAIRELSDDIEQVMRYGESLKKSQAENQQDIAENNAACVKGLNDFKLHHKSMTKRIFDEMRDTNNNVAIIENEVTRMQKKPRTVRTPSSSSSAGFTDPTTATKLKDLTTCIQDLRTRTLVLESEVRSLQSPGLSGGIGGMNSVRQRTSPVTKTAIDLITDRFDKEMKEVNKKLVDLRSAPDNGKSYSIGPFTFNSPLDLEPLFGIKDMEDPQLSCCWDLFAALDNMESKGHDGKLKNDEAWSAERLKTNVDESNNLATFDYYLPGYLFAKGNGGQKSIDRELGLQACPSYGKWIGDGINSYRVTLEDRLTSFQGKIMGSIKNDGSPGSILATLLCNNLLSQWYAIANFVETTQRQLVSVSHFTVKATWDLIGRYLAAIFLDMRKFRSRVASLTNDTDTKANKIKILWAIIQSHRVVDEYIKVKFKSHPSIVSEIGSFMLTERVDPSKFKELSDLCTSLVRDVKDAKAEAKKSAETAAALSKQLATDRANWKNEIKELAKKIKP